MVYRNIPVHRLAFLEITELGFAMLLKPIAPVCHVILVFIVLVTKPLNSFAIHRVLLIITRTLRVRPVQTGFAFHVQMGHFAMERVEYRVDFASLGTEW